MEQIAFVLGHVNVYWSSVIVTLAVCSAVCMFLSLHLYRGGQWASGLQGAALAVLLSLLLARLCHWYCRPEGYESIFTALWDHTRGGYALMGIFGGCALAVFGMDAAGLEDHPRAMLDHMSIAGCLGMAVGRLSFFFRASDRGMILSGGSFPWVYPMVNPVSGAEELRLATFLLQAIVAAVLFALLLMVYLKKKPPAGDITLLFLLCHGAAQVLLDSTRYDSLSFRSNGFVGVVQVLGALAMGLVMVVFSVRLVRKQGFRPKFLAVWIPLPLLLGLGGYMEYHVQRHADQALFAYSVMGICLGALVALTLLLRHWEELP